MAKVPLNGKRPSPKRVQDWISSVLNPIIDGLRREQGLLERKTWHWLPTRESFEYLHPVASFVAEIYRDNLDDFLLKNADLRPLIKKHDEALADVSAAVSAIFQKLMGPKTAQIRNSARFSDELRWKYFASFVAANLKEIPPDEPVALEYERLLPKAESVVHDEKADAESKAKVFRSRVDALLDACVELRTSLADQYGARIIPVEY